MMTRKLTKPTIDSAGGDLQIITSPFLSATVLTADSFPTNLRLLAIAASAEFCTTTELTGLLWRTSHLD
jgi:hypothetical protein